MDTYVAKVQIGNNSANLAPIASTMFGVCNSSATASTKVVTFSKFDNLIHGVTIFVKFSAGNDLPSNLKLQVNNTLAYDITGDCICGTDEIIAFTFDEVDATHKYWRANSSGITSAMKQFIINTINTSTDTPDVLIIKGSIGTGGNPGYLPQNEYETGWAYRVVANGTFIGQVCEPGDLIVAVQDAPSGQTIINPAHWIILQGKIENAVSGPASSTANHVAIFDNATGRLITDSGFTIGTSVPADAVFTDHYDWTDITNKPTTIAGYNITDAASDTHVHGNITNNGKINNGNGNSLLMTDSQTINIKEGPAFGNNGNEFLNNKGEWIKLIEGTSSADGHIAEWDWDTTNSNLFLKDSGKSVSDFANSTHSHGNINEDGILLDGANDPQPKANVLLKTNQNGEIVFGPVFDTTNNVTRFLTESGTWDTISLENLNIDAIRFIGKATNDIVPGTGSGNKNPGLQGYTWPGDYNIGDIVLGATDGREYILTGEGNPITKYWVLLGQDASTTFDSNILFPNNTRPTNAWVSRIQQSSDRIITVSMDALDTTGTWSGNAATATQFESPQTVYVDLTSSGNQSTIQGGSNTAQVLQVNGILGISNGGTNTDEFPKNQVILSNNPITGTKATELVSRAFIEATVTNNIIDSRAIGTSDNFITENAVYAGLPVINNSHAYTSDNDIYAPISAGTQYQILVSNGTSNAPVWATAALLQSEISSTADVSALTTLTLGNSGNVTTTAAHSEGQIILYSANSGSHTIKGANTGNDDYTHTLPCYSGYIVQAFDANAVGSQTQPVYIKANGEATALTYTANKLYYSASTTSFAETNHYATANVLAINKTSITTDYTFEVNGNTNLLGTLNTTGIVTITNTTDTTIGSSPTGGALIVSGGAIINKKVNIGDNTYIDGTLTVTGATTLNNTLYVADASTLTGRVGIGGNPDNTSEGNNNDWHILKIYGSTVITTTNDNESAHLDILSENNNEDHSIKFYPASDGHGYVGLESNRWYEGYFSNLLEIGSISSGNISTGIELNAVGLATIKTTSTSNNVTTINTITLETNTTGSIEIESAIPTIILNTSAQNASGWTITNNAGEFKLSNGKSSPIELIGNDYGFELKDRLYINPLASLDNQSDLDLYVHGTSELLGAVGIGVVPNNSDILVIQGNTSFQALHSSTGYPAAHLNVDMSNNNSIGIVEFYPDTDTTGSLGTSSYHWGAVYIGTDDTYGDVYTPIYWHDGVPEEVEVVQQYDFTISTSNAATATTVISLSNTNKARTVVNSIVVTNGMENLNGVITWSINSSGNIVLSTADTSGDVDGYILTSIGAEPVQSNT